jgi:tetratricopeptide (TPR) repeat protein
MFFIARDEIIPEVRTWIEAAVDDQAAELGVPLATALSTGGVLAWSVGDLTEADRLQSRSLQLARELGGSAEIFRATGDLGLIAIDRGDFERARELFSEGLDVARDRDQPGDIAVALANLAHVVPGRDQEELILEALRIHRETGRLTGTSHMSLMLGWMHLSNGELESARDWFDDALHGFTELGNQGSEVEALCGLADVALQVGDLDLARGSVEHAETLAAHIDWPGAGAMTLTRSASLLRVEDPQSCLEVLAGAGDAWSRSGLEAGLAENLGLRAVVAMELGDLDAAAGWCAESAAKWESLRRGAGVAWAATIAAEVHRHNYGPEAALPHYGEALASYCEAQREPHTIDGFLAPGPGTRSELIDAMERAAICSVAAGRQEAGVAALQAVAEERRRTGIVANERLKAARVEGDAPARTEFEDAAKVDAAVRQAATSFLDSP